MPQMQLKNAPRKSKMPLESASGSMVLDGTKKCATRPVRICRDITPKRGDMQTGIITCSATMNRIAILSLLLNAVLSSGLQAGVEADKAMIVTCEGQVVRFKAYAMHARVEGGGVELSDKTMIRFASPEEWAGLRVLSQALPDDHPLTREGQIIKFRIAKVYLVGEYRRDDGKLDAYIPAEGALEFVQN